MISLPTERPTDYKCIEDQVSRLRSSAELRAYFEQFMERYVRLNERYLFTESFDPQFVFDQLDAGIALCDRELFGVPFGVKDVFNTAVLPTSMGSEIWRGFQAGNNARVVDEIVDRGGIVFSKTTTAEFAVHYIQNGRTINPHDATRITGTSSAGSAVAVACGALPIALGTQTAGSIVRPASFCGTFGFKPSFGAFDRTGCLKTADTLDTIGFLGSDLYGLRRAFFATFQQDRNYPFAKRYADHLRRFRTSAKLKIGIVTDQFDGFRNYEADVKADFAAAVDRLANAGHEVTPLTNVSFINDIHPLHDKIYCKSLSYYFQEEFKRGSGMSDVMSEMIARGSSVTPAEYMDALKQQPEYRARFDSVIADYDFLLTPSTASVAPLLGEQERDDTCLIWTFFGYPVMSLPVFQSSSTGLPFGLQVIAPKYGDLALLEFAGRILRDLEEA